MCGTQHMIMYTHICIYICDENNKRLRTHDPKLNVVGTLGEQNKTHNESHTTTKTRTTQTQTTHHNTNQHRTNGRLKQHNAPTKPERNQTRTKPNQNETKPKQGKRKWAEPGPNQNQNQTTPEPAPQTSTITQQTKPEPQQNQQLHQTKTRAQHGFPREADGCTRTFLARHTRWPHSRSQWVKGFEGVTHIACFNRGTYP